MRNIRVVGTSSVVAVLAVAAVVHLRWVDLSLRLAGSGYADRRRIMPRVHMRWWSRTFRVWRRLAGMTLDLPDSGALSPDRPVIVIANHLSEYDIPVLCEVLRRLGVEDAQWVANADLLRLPVVGRTFRYAAVPVERRVGSQDAESVARAARQAHLEGQSMVIFPEGTTYRQEIASPDWTGLLRPRCAGYAALAKELPEHGVLAVTISYGDPVGTGLMSIGDFLGRKISVRVRYHGLVHDSPEEWIEKEWRRMESLLSELRVG